MKRIACLLLAAFLISAMLPLEALAVGKPKGSYSSVTFTKSETKTYQMKCFNGFTVKSGVTLTLSASCGFEIAGDLVVEPGAALVGNGNTKGQFAFSTGPETTITGIDLYYYHDSRDGSPVKLLKWPCTLQYALKNVPSFAEMAAQDQYPAFKWDSSIPGWVLNLTLNGNPFNDPALFYHQKNANDLALKTAGRLNTLGLFAGVGKNADGSNNYDLWRKGTRLEALVMLIRLLGYEDEVKAMDALVKAGQAQWNCPFNDVKTGAAWAVPYVSYAYEIGLTSGQSATQFGLGNVTYQQFCAFILKALGYTEADFPGSSLWASCINECENMGICSAGTPDTICTVDDLFWRADMVLMSWQAMNCRARVEGNPLLFEKLAGDGLFTVDLYRSVEAN